MPARHRVVMDRAEMNLPVSLGSIGFLEVLGRNVNKS
jgi:hypothetical protein